MDGILILPKIQLVFILVLLIKMLIILNNMYKILRVLLLKYYNHNKYRLKLILLSIRKVEIWEHYMGLPKRFQIQSLQARLLNCIWIHCLRFEYVMNIG
jgi:hypothetical protein